MITEISNYVNSLGETLNWLLFENRKLEQGEYFFFDSDETGEKMFKLAHHFSVAKNGDLSPGAIENQIYSYITDNDLFRKLFLSRCVSSNKTFIKQIFTNNQFCIQFNTKNLEKLNGSVDKFYETTGEYYSEIISAQGFSKYAAWAESIFRQLLNENFSKKPAEDIKVTVYFNLPVDLFNLLSGAYFKQKIYNTNEYTVNNGEYGIHSFKIDTNQKKPYKFSRSSFVHSFRLVDFETATNLNVFEYILKLKENKVPNPLPLFLVQSELNVDVIDTIKITGKLSYREIVRELYEKRGSDLGNYYLLNWGKGMSISINDLDYVESFRYRISELKIFSLLHDKSESTSIRDIFQFESKVFNPLFFNLLITGKDNPIYHYFDDLSGNKFLNRLPYKKVVNNLGKYRYAVYEYIYKSKTDAVSGRMILDLALTNVTDLLLSSDEVPFDSIRNILNILFSVNHIFDHNNTNFGGRNMPSELPGYFSKLESLTANPDDHIQDDYLYAFSAGQVVYYLLSQSQSSNKTHSLVEPFINRTSAQAFNEQLIRVFNQYKHAIGFNNRRFNRIFDEILGYNPEANYKELLPVFLAGYFGDNIFYRKQSN